MTMTSASSRKLQFLLAASAVALLVSVLMLGTGTSSIRIIGWLLAGPIVTILIGVRRLDVTRWRAHTGRLRPRWEGKLTAGMVVLGFGVSLAHASAFALALS
ncbi:MAG: hypothetical protein ACRDZ8_21120 [Acidimicrobiales bacterium]